MFCPQDVKDCGDDNFVGRDPTNGCEFYPCPCTLEISLECKIDDTDIACEDYTPSADRSDCRRTATYIHVLHNKAPFNSGGDLLLTSIMRNRPGDNLHGPDYDFLDELYNGEPFTLEAAFRIEIKESPIINFCDDDTEYVTTFEVKSNPTNGGNAKCMDEVMYTLDLSS